MISWDNLGDGIGARTDFFQRDANGYTVAVDIIFNNYYHWNADDPNYPSNCDPLTGAKDIEDVAAHEIGHIWGLWHVSDAEATMYGSSSRCETKRRTLEDGDKEGSVFLNREVSGTISSDVTWCSGTPAAQVHVIGNTWLASGATLTIEPGVIVKFVPGASLIANGFMNAVGTSSYPITFTSIGYASPGSWGSIILDGSGAAYSTLDHVVMRYGNEIQCLNGAHAIIQDCTLQDNSNGVYVYNASPWIWYNTIKNVQSHGVIANNLGAGIFGNTIIKESSTPWGSYHQNCAIWYNNADDYIARNSIKGFGMGLYATYSSSPYFGHRYMTDQRNNLITDCTYGVVALENSNPTVGRLDDSQSGYNSLSCLVRECDANDGCFVQADRNWWGEYPVNVAQSFYIGYDADITYYNGPLDYDPWQGYGQSLVATLPANSKYETAKSNILESNTISSKAPIPPAVTGSGDKIAVPPEEQQLSQGIDLMRGRQYRAAIDMFKSLYNSGKLAKLALSNLYMCYKDTSRDEGIKFFQPLIEKKSPDSPLLMRYVATLYALNGDYRTANGLYDEMIAEYPNKPDERYARFQKFYLAMHVDRNRASAASLLKDITSRYSDGEDVAFAKYMFSNMNDVAGKTEPIAHPDERAMTENAAVSDAQMRGLATNYPNPFNPATTIGYQLPTGCHATLKVYDVLGREVMTLVDSHQEAGVHVAYFNGQNLASGVYFYRMTATGINQVRKMLLTK